MVARSRLEFLKVGATRCGLPNAGNPYALNPDGQAGETYKTWHKTPKDAPLVNPVLVYSNHYLTAASPAEVTAGLSALQVAASIEYPTGAYLWAEKDGAELVDMAVGSDLFFNPIGVVIPADTWFAVRTYVKGADSTVRWPMNIRLGSAATNIDYRQAADSNTTQGGGTPATALLTSGEDTGGSSAAFNGSFAYGPSVILNGYTAYYDTAAIMGDSIGVGHLDNGDADGNIGYIERALTNEIPYFRLGKRGDSALRTIAASGAVNGARRRKKLVLPIAPNVIWEYGVNDIIGSRTFAQLRDDTISTVTELKNAGKRVFGCTLTPYTTSTDSWATTANQTHASGFGSGGVREQYNDWLVANSLDLFTGTFDVRPYCDDGTGKWVVTGAANYATTDGIHPSTAMSALMAGAVDLAAIRAR